MTSDAETADDVTVDSRSVGTGMSVTSVKGPMEVGNSSEEEVWLTSAAELVGTEVVEVEEEEYPSRVQVEVK